MKRNLFYLHILLLVYSLTEIFSKLAAGASFPSMKFCAFYGMVLFILFVYALGWQQIIKQIPLSTAFANKAVTTIWGTVWGVLLFHERFSVGKLIGILIIVAGILLFTAEGVEADE